jgi:hypothetical protein
VIGTPSRIFAARSGAIASLAFAFVFAAGTAGAQPTQPKPDAIVTTIAGEGAAGYADGPALRATFMEPTALAYGPSGELYIADQGAQRIRMLRNGIVSTVAGSGDDVTSDQHVTGGYADGDALRARFDEPIGIAVDARGVIYVADRDNHCIRRIEGGRVDTFAGSPERTKASDGPRSRASFTLPTAITIDSAGNLYVADYGVGLREISRAGSVTTLKLDSSNPSHFIGISATGPPGAVTLFATQSDGGFVRYSVATGISHFESTSVESAETTHPWGLAAIDGFAFVSGDIDTNVIRLYRSIALPFVTHGTGDPIAGIPFARGPEGAGYADGPAHSAKFYLPSAVAVRDGNVAIAEAGNRRLRLMPLPDVRFPIGSDVAQLTKDPAHYRILFAGASYTFWATTWQNSIPGRLEFALAAERARLGIPRPPLVSVARLDEVEPAKLTDYISSFAGDGQVDLVVLMLDTFHLAPPVQDALSALEAQLARSGTRLFVVEFTDGPCTSRAEWFVYVQTAGPPATCPALETKTREGLRRSGVAYYLMDEDLFAYESSDTRLPLYGPELTAHPTNPGYAVMARLLIREIETRRPWASP